MKNTLQFITFVGTLLASSVALAAPPPPPQAVPIDGGISLVIAGCVGYGAKKIYDKKKKNQTP
jgi:hypothetical protein